MNIECTKVDDHKHYIPNENIPEENSESSIDKMSNSSSQNTITSLSDVQRQNGFDDSFCQINKPRQIQGIERDEVAENIVLNHRGSVKSYILELKANG